MNRIFLSVIFLSVIFFLLFSFSASSTTNIWAEGFCDGQRINEGATREHFNRGAGLLWENFLGDWLDKNSTPQGDIPFSFISVEDTDSEQTLTTDVTELVNIWLQDRSTNQGVVIRKLTGGTVSFISKEVTDQTKRATLSITTDNGTINIPVTADSFLSSSTYKCLGQQEALSSAGTILLYFDLSTMPSDSNLLNATLTISTTKKQYGQTTLGTFQANPKYITYQFSETNEGIAQEYPNDYELQNDPRVYLVEPFEHNDWGKKWTYGQDQHTLSLVDSNTEENFQALSGRALQSQLPQGELTALNLNYVFKDERGNEPTEIYFRYYIRFGENWDTVEGGKLPGIAGTYAGTDYQGGWGGRKSNGTNGWSARGAYHNILKPGNPLANKVPVGTYLYHADMESYYGDNIIWDGSGLAAFDKNRWYSIEQYVKLNFDGKNNGVLKSWINGVPAYERTGLRFRDADHEFINIEKIWMNIYHGGTTPADKTITAFIDNIVIASEYIGPTVFDPDLPSAGSELNQLPVINTPVPEKSAILGKIGETFEFSADIHDPDGDDIEIKWFDNYNLMVTNEFNYAITPTLSDAGDHQILLEVSDDSGAKVQHEWNLSVDSNNIVKLSIEEDTYIEKSTYKAMGSKEFLSSKGPMYFRTSTIDTIQEENITAARLLLFDNDQYGDAVLSTYRADNSWREGNHTKDGVTREFKDYTSRAIWRNYLGDWFDSNNLLNGSTPYSMLDVVDSDIARFIEIDVTEIVLQQWTSGDLNFAVLSTAAHQFYSKDSELTEKHPKLVIALNGVDDGTLPIDDLPPPSDMNTGTDLEELSQELLAGEWGDLITEDFEDDLLYLNIDEKRLHIAGWTDDAHWDPASQQFLYMGFRKQTKFISYQQENNHWKIIPYTFDWPIETNTGHIYGNNALDVATGSYYHHLSKTREIHKYSIQDNTWSVLPQINIPKGDLGTSIEFYPELGGLVRLSRSGLQLFSTATLQWQSLYTLENLGYHSLMRYNPITKELLIMGGNYAPTKVVSIDANGIAKEHKNSPIDLSIRADKLLIHPITGHYLIFTKNKLYDFDSQNDIYTEVTDYSYPFDVKEMPITATIMEHGVIMFVDKNVRLFKPPVIINEQCDSENNPNCQVDSQSLDE